MTGSFHGAGIWCLGPVSLYQELPSNGASWCLPGVSLLDCIGVPLMEKLASGLQAPLEVRTSELVRIFTAGPMGPPSCALGAQGQVPIPPSPGDP